MLTEMDRQRMREQEANLRPKRGDDVPLDMSKYSDNIWYTYRYNKETKEMEYIMPD